MFSAFKYRLAKNKVLMSLEIKQLLSKEKSILMREIMSNDMNKELGISCIKENMVNKYQCAAIIFVRLQSLYDKNPRNGLTSYEWYLAAIEALIMAGWSEKEALLLNTEMIGNVS